MSQRAQTRLPWLNGPWGKYERISFPSLKVCKILLENFSTIGLLLHGGPGHSGSSLCSKLW